jgi:hypothetical protein
VKARIAALRPPPMMIVLGVVLPLVCLVEHAQAQYNAAYAVSPILRLVAGETTNVPLKVTNTGTALWNNAGPCAVVLGYHWFKGPTRLASEPQAATLPAPVSPGHAVELTAAVSAPPAAGSYVLAWDLRAKCEWLSNLGAAPGKQQVEVAPKR